MYLIDTPGFNDTNRPDIETLQILATYLGASYANGVRIHGLIVMHPISDNRMAGSSLRNIELIKAVYGSTTYNNLAVVTTMWPESPNAVEAKSLGDREEELLATERYFGAFIAKGATKFRYSETGYRNTFGGMASAQDIVNHLIVRRDVSPPRELQLQHELINEGKTLGETAAGIAVGERLLQARQTYMRELKGLDTKLRRELSKANGSHASRLREQQAEVDKKLTRVEIDRQALNKSMHHLHKQEEKALRAKLDNVNRRLRDQILATEEELTKMERSLRETLEKEEKTRDQRRPESKQPQRQDERRQGMNYEQQLQKEWEQAVRRVQGLEKMISDQRREIDNMKARKSFWSLHGQSSNTWNGTINGVAAGVTSGVVGVSKYSFLISLASRSVLSADMKFLICSVGGYVHSHVVKIPIESFFRIPRFVE